MRLEQQIRASIARSAVVARRSCLFASGMSGVRFRTDAGRRQPAAPTAVRGRAGPGRAGPGTPVSHRRSGADGAREQPRDPGRAAESADPGTRRRAGARRRTRRPCSPTRRSSNSTSPPTDFTTPAPTRRSPPAPTSDQRRRAAADAVGRRQLLRSSFDGVARRRPSDQPTLQPAARLEPQRAPSPSRCCAISRSTRTGSSCCSAQNQQEIADLQLQQRSPRPARNVRTAYYDLVGAIAGLEVAQQSLELSRAVAARTTRPASKSARWRRSTSSKRRRKSRATRKRSSSSEAPIESAEDMLRTLVMNPSQPDFWTVRFDADASSRR